MADYTQLATTQTPYQPTPVLVNPQSTIQNPGTSAVISGNAYADYKSVQQNNLANIDQSVQTQKATTQQTEAQKIQQQIADTQAKLKAAQAAGYTGAEEIKYDAQGNIIPKPKASADVGSAVNKYLNGDKNQPQWSDVPYQDVAYPKQPLLPNSNYKIQYDQNGNTQAIPMNDVEIANKSIAEENAKFTQQAQAVQDQITRIQNGTFPLTADQQGQLSELSASFDRQIAAQELANKNYTAGMTTAGISSGRNRYAPEIEMGNIKGTIDAGIQKIADLNSKKVGALADMRSAIANNNLKLIQTAWQVYNDSETKITENIKYMADKVYQQEKDARDYNQKQQLELQKDINGVVSDLAKNPGVPMDIINRVSQSGSLSEAVQNAGEYLQTGTGIVGEYLYYKRQAESMGQTPMDFNSYQTIDANRKARATAIADSSGMTTRQNVNFMGITNKFQADTIMGTANQAKTAIQIAEQAKANPANAGDQLTILYTLVKNLDPNSAVREGELSLAQTTQSYLSKFQTSLERISTGKVISADATKTLADATISLAKKWEEAGLRRENQYKAQAQVAGVGDAFNQYLGSIERPYSNDSINKESQATDSIVNWIGIDTKKRAQYEELKQLLPNATATEIAKELGIQ